MNVFSTDQTICRRNFSYQQLKLYNPYIYCYIQCCLRNLYFVYLETIASVFLAHLIFIHACLFSTTLCWWHWKCFKTELFRNTIREVQSLFWKMTDSIHQEHTTNFSIIITSFTLILFMFSPSQLLTSKLRISQHVKS